MLEQIHTTLAYFAQAGELLWFLFPLLVVSVGWLAAPAVLPTLNFSNLPPTAIYAVLVVFAFYVLVFLAVKIYDRNHAAERGLKAR